MAPDVIKVKTLPDYCIEAEFETGELRWFDMKPLLGFPAFSALKDKGLFMRASVVYGTVT